MNEEMIALIETFGTKALDYGFNIVGALALLLIGWLVAGWVRRATRRMLGRLPNSDKTVNAVFSNIARYLTLGIVLVLVLGQFGVETASILAVLGTAGLAIGLALQGALSNIAAGLLILFLRPFKIGDYIDAEGISGTVEEIGLFSTEFTTYDGLYVAAPNSQIFSRSITNYSVLPTRRIDVQIGIAYGDDIDAALAALKKMLEADERVLKDPACQVMVVALADSSINLNLRCWTKVENYWSLLFDLNKAAKDCVEGIGCSIPFPQRDVHMINPSAAA